MVAVSSASTFIKGRGKNNKNHTNIMVLVSLKLDFCQVTDTIITPSRSKNILVKSGCSMSCCLLEIVDLV